MLYFLHIYIMYTERTPLDTRQVFDRIAPGWYGFRHHSIFTTELEDMARRWRSGKLLNIGCAHGPDFVPFIANFNLTGLDFSGQMLSLADKYACKFNFGVNLVLGDAVHLPFSENTFDFAIAIATFHHIESKESRLAAFRELHRVLKPGGEAFITVWNRWQPRFWGHGHDTNVPWKNKGQVLQRYYHLYSYRELTKQAQQAGLSILRVEAESTYKFPLNMFSRNICLLVRK
jgi:tRNA (uracil-5-)-methyltransferase TRM9